MPVLIRCPVDMGVLILCPRLRLGKNKRVGKQLASQKILQLLHPHVRNWGSLLRMYGRESSKMAKQVAGLGGGAAGRWALPRAPAPRASQQPVCVLCFGQDVEISQLLNFCAFRGN